MIVPFALENVLGSVMGLLITWTALLDEKGCIFSMLGRGGEPPLDSLNGEAVP